jgi:hypothetical protein
LTVTSYPEYDSNMTSKRSQEDFREFQLGDLTDIKGWLYRPLAGSAVLVPSSVELKEEGLQWRVSFPLTVSNYRQTGNGLLEDFIKLIDASKEQIRAYAERWGVLQICKHGYSRSHNSATWPRSWLHLSRWARYVPESWCQPLRFQCGINQCGKKTPANKPLLPLYGEKGCLSMDFYEEGWEPIERWRYFSSQARAILKIAANVNQDLVAMPDDWELVYQAYKNELDPRLDRQNIDDNRRLISFALNDWLQLGDVRPQFVWKDEMPKLEIGGPTLFSHLAVQLTLVASRTQAIVFCSHCGNQYRPSKRPNRNRRNFCDKCVEKKVPVALASHDYRKRKDKLGRRRK